VIDVLVQAAYESYDRIRRDGLFGLGKSGCLIVSGFVVLLVAVLAYVVVLRF
jgi:hypothetical protein